MNMMPISNICLHLKKFLNIFVTFRAQAAAQSVSGAPLLTPTLIVGSEGGRLIVQTRGPLTLFHDRVIKHFGMCARYGRSIYESHNRVIWDIVTRPKTLSAMWANLPAIGLGVDWKIVSHNPLETSEKYCALLSIFCFIESASLSSSLVYTSATFFVIKSYPFIDNIV